MPPPPPPPPGPGPPPPPPPSGGGSKAGGTQNRSALLDQIHHGARLKKAVTNDRSAPQLAAGKNPGGDHGGRGGGGPAAMGGLFAGGMPKLKSGGQAKLPGGVGGPALKPPGSMSNGPTSEGGRLSNGGPLPPPPPSTNKPPANKFAPPTPPSSAGKPRNVGGPPPPPVQGNNKPSKGGASGRLNSDAFRKFSTSVDDNDNSSGTTKEHALSLAGGLASRTPQNQSSVPKHHTPFGVPPSSPNPPPPPNRPPPSNATRPNSMLGRPLPPPPPGDNESVVGPGRLPPPPPSRVVAPPPPPNRGNAPPPPPQRTPNTVIGGTVGRSGPPNMRLPAQRRGSIGSVIQTRPQIQPPPTRPQIQPPPSSRNKLSENSNSAGEDFESRFRFHAELPHPQPFNNINKVYPSESPRHSGIQRPPPPQPPRSLHGN